MGPGNLLLQTDIVTFYFFIIDSSFSIKPHIRMLSVYYNITIVQYQVNNGKISVKRRPLIVERRAFCVLRPVDNH